MKKLSLKNLKLEVNDLLQREQLKTVFGGQNDGFDCGPIAYACDAKHPDDYTAFKRCMFWEGCL